MKIVTYPLIAYLFYGMGGFHTSGGVDQIAAELKAIPGVQVKGPYSYHDWKKIAAEMKADRGDKVVIGFSCGAGASEWAAATSKVPVKEIIGIQESEYCKAWPLSGNIEKAMEIYNPHCLRTLGLGCASFVPSKNFKGHIHLVPRYVGHTVADYDPATQKMIVAEVKALLPPPEAPVQKHIPKTLTEKLAADLADLWEKLFK